MFGDSGANSLAGLENHVVYELKKGTSVEELNASVNEILKGDHPAEQDPARGLLVAWGNFMGIPLDVYWSNEQMTPRESSRNIKWLNTNL